MGPGTDKASHRGIADHPMFSPNKDLYTWRKDITNWDNLIKVGAEEGEEKLYKTVFKTLGRQLYSRGLPHAQKSIVDHAQEIGKINCKQPNQVSAVLQIVDLIAVDPPIVVVSRLIESFNRVSKCCRKKSESLSGLNSEHLMYADTSQNSKLGEVLAISLITNANLEETTHQSAKIQLINAAKTRDLEDSNKGPPRAKCTFIGSACADLREVNAKIVHTIDALETALNVTGAEETVANAKQALEFAKTSLELIQPIQEALLGKIIDPPDSDRASSSVITVRAKRLPIYLDDDIFVIRSLEQGNSPLERSMSVVEVENIVKKALLASQGKSASSSNPKITDSDFNQKLKTLFGQSQKDIEKALQRPKDLNGPGRPVSKIFCKEFGEKGHDKGDPKCKNPSLHTLKLCEQSRKKQDKGEEYQNEEEPKRGMFFRRSSRPNRA